MALSGFETTITWNLFREVASAPPGIDESAQTNTRAVTSRIAGGRSGGVARVTTVMVEVVVNRANSWVVTDQKTDRLLRHEQGHYDIVALGAREIFNRIMAVTGTSGDDVLTQTNAIEREVQAKIVAADLRYDSQTDHYRSIGAQATWDNAIRTAKSNPQGTIDNLPT